MAGRDSWLPLPLVGRREELAAIGGALEAARGGTASAVVIAGSYGIGKTRLLQAVLAEARARNFLIAHGTASQTDADLPYSVFVDAFTPVVLAQSAKTLDDLARGTRADLARVVPAFDPHEARPSGTPAPDDVTSRVRWHFTQFLERLSAAPQALLLAIDNAHWADPSSVGLIQFILRHAPRARVLVVATDNPLESDVNSPFRSVQKSIPTQLTLSALGEADVLELLATSFKVPADAVADFAAALFQRTMGNPFFIEEILKSLVERGTLRRLNGEWVGWSTEDFQLPATVRDVVVARIAALSMLQDDPASAPYGWTHALTMPLAVLAIAAGARDETALVRIAATHALGFRATMGKVALDFDFRPPRPASPAIFNVEPLAAAGAAFHADPRARPALWSGLATRSARSRDAHLAKYTLAAMDAAGTDPEAAPLYLAAAAFLGAWWDAHPGAAFEG